MPFFRNPSEGGDNSIAQDTAESLKAAKDEGAKFLETAKSSLKPQVQSPQAQQQAAQRAQAVAQQKSRWQKFISDAIRDDQYKDAWLRKKEMRKQQEERKEAEDKQIKEIKLKRRTEEMSQAVANAKRKGETRNKSGAA